MSTILVTGGLGVVGSGLVKELSNRGHGVIACDLLHRPDEMGFSLPGEMAGRSYARCDISEYRQLIRLFEAVGPFDYVFNCAAEFGRWNGEDVFEALWRSNVIGMKNLIRLQEKPGIYKPFRLVHFSSSEVYGDWPGTMVESVMDEYEVKQLNDYAMTKWVNEGQIRNSATQFGTESVIVRLFNSYGPFEYYSPYRSVNCRFLYSALHGQPWTVFRGHSRTSTYLPDMVRTLANIVDCFKPGEVYNIGGNTLHTIEELSDIVLKVTGADPGLVSYRDAEILTTKLKKVDASKAIRELGHRDTVTLEEGMRITADWMRKAYAL